MERVRRLLLVVSSVLCIGSGANADAANVDMSGTIAYTYLGATAVLTADRIDNNDYYGYSGTLRLELWASPTPYVGIAQFGYKLAQYSVGQLTAGYYYYDVSSGNVPFVPPPDGTYHMTMLLTEFDGYDFAVRDYLAFSRMETFGLPPPPPPLATAIAVEYYHAAFGHYFITAAAAEIQALDIGVFAGWSRTGQTFKVWSVSSPGLAGVCRFFSASFAPRSSHFYTPNSTECAQVQANHDWQYEGIVAYTGLPSGAGVCSTGMPLYRLYNNGRSGAPNHRYTTSLPIRSTMLAQGWVPEGAGSLGVIACVPQ
jgi:hypothetical protein